MRVPNVVSYNTEQGAVFVAASKSVCVCVVCNQHSFLFCFFIPEFLLSPSSFSFRPSREKQTFFKSDQTKKTAIALQV